MHKFKLYAFEIKIVKRVFQYIVLSLGVTLLALLLLALIQGINHISYVPEAIVLSSMGLILMVIFLMWVLSQIKKEGLHPFGFELPYEEYKGVTKAYQQKIDELSMLKTTYFNIKESAENYDGQLRIKRNSVKALDISEKSLEALDILLNDFFKKVSERIGRMIWITDYQGKVVYLNDLCIKHTGPKEMIQSIYDIMDISKTQFDLFRARDFENIKYYLKEMPPLNGKSYRIFSDENLKFILFMSDVTNQEKKMTLNYLKKSRDLHFINEISKIISGEIAIDSTLQDALDKIAFLGNFTACTIRLINDKDELEVKARSGYSDAYFSDEKLKTEHSHIGYAFNENKIITINGPKDTLFDDSLIKNVLENDKKIAFIPLTNYDRNLGVMSIVSDYVFDQDTMILLESISINVTIALEKILLYDQLKSNYFKTVEAFVTASEIKSERVKGHSRRVAEICKIIAEKLYLSTTEVDEIYMAGLLHDVGKLAFSDHSVEYYFDVEDHGHIGRKMVEGVGLTSDILEGIEYHHMNYDLTNNKNQKLTEQPYYAQIIRIANDFDMFMNDEGTEKYNLSFIDKMHYYIGTTYSPQFMRIFKEILSEPENMVLNIYKYEGVNEA